MSYNILFMFFFILCILRFGIVSVLFCALFLSLNTAVTYSCTSPPTTATGWTPNCSKYHTISRHTNSNLLPAHTEPWHEQSALCVTNRNSVLFFAPTPTTRHPYDFACKKKTPPRRKFCPQNGAFQQWSVTEPFSPTASTQARAPTQKPKPPRPIRGNVCQFCTL
jgi:hypothetical protein